jgi:hypothetical protein
MRYRRIPPNIDIFSPTMFGLRYRTLLLIITLSLITVFTLEVNPMLSIFVAAISVTGIIIEMTGKTGILKLFTRLAMPPGGRKYSPEFSFAREGADIEGLFRLSGKLRFIALLEPRMLPETRESEQINILNGFKRLLSDISVDSEFFAYTGLEETGDAESKILAVFSHSPGSSLNSATALADESIKFLEGIASLNFNYAIPQVSELENLFKRLFSPDTSNNSKSNSVMHLRRNFISGERNYLMLELRDSDYDSGPLLYAFLEGSGIGTVTRLSIHRIQDDQALRLLKSARADRKAQIRISGDSIVEHGTGVSQQIETINSMEEGLKKDRDSLLRTSLTLSLIGAHPVHLTNYERTYRRSLNYLGLDFSIVRPKAESIGNIFPASETPKGKYLMSASSVSTIIPISFSPPVYGDIEVGTDDLNAKPVFLPINYGAANNFMIIGETGSGKSFFTGLIIRRMIKKGLIDCLYVYDPLEEYDYTDIESDSPPQILILRNSGETARAFARESMMNLYRLMTSDLRRKAIIIEESHTAIFDDESRKYLESMVRHSRHYNTIIFNITQNADDMTKAENASLALNSTHIFIFRTRKISPKDHIPLKIDGFTAVEPQNLLGGKGYPYSECYYSDGKYCRRLRIFAEE